MRNRMAVLFSSVIAVGMMVAVPASLWAGGNSYSGTEDPNKKVIKQAVVGAGTGAIAAEVSGGKAGKGALVGAGTNVIGSAVLDALTTSPAPQQAPSGQPQKKIIRHYDKDGRVVSEEEVWE